MERAIITWSTADEFKEFIKESIQETLENLNYGHSRNDKKSKEVMTVDELAEYLGVKPQTIYNYKNEGKIPYTKKIGLRFLKSEIDKWLMEQK